MSCIIISKIAQIYILKFVQYLQRWNDFGEFKIQRDIYSAFLIMNVNTDLKTINKEKCDETFENFLMLHNKEVARLKGNKNLSSIAI